MSLPQKIGVYVQSILLQVRNCAHSIALLHYVISFEFILYYSLHMCWRGRATFLTSKIQNILKLLYGSSTPPLTILYYMGIVAANEEFLTNFSVDYNFILYPNREAFRFVCTERPRLGPIPSPWVLGHTKIVPKGLLTDTLAVLRGPAVKIKLYHYTPWMKVCSFRPSIIKN